MVAIGAVAFAQAPDTTQLPRVLNAITVDAKAINDAPESQPPETLVKLAGETDAFVHQVKMLAPDNPAAQRLLVQLTETSARMVSHATYQDRSQAASDARDLIVIVAQLRGVLGLPPG